MTLWKISSPKTNHYCPFPIHRVNPKSYAKRVIKIKYFDEKEKIVIKKTDIKVHSNFDLVDSSKSKIKQLTQKERKGQASFRKNILHIYNGACAVTGIKQKELVRRALAQIEYANMTAVVANRLEDINDSSKPRAYLVDKTGSDFMLQTIEDMCTAVRTLIERGN